MAIFNNSKNTDTNKPSNKQNILGFGTTVTGNISCDGPIRIDGKLEGNISSKNKVIIGKTGEIEGDILANDVDIEGRANGKILSKNTIYIKSTAKVVGEVASKSLSIEEGATFNAMSKTNKEETLQLTSNTKNLKAN